MLLHSFRFKGPAVSRTAKRFNKIDTKEKLKHFICSSPKNDNLHTRYEAKKATTDTIELDINNLLKLSGLPIQKTDQEILDLKKHLLKYIQFTNMLDDVAVNTENRIKCDNLGNPFLLQDEVIGSLEELKAKIQEFNEKEVEKFDPKQNTKLNNGNFFTFKKNIN